MQNSKNIYIKPIFIFSKLFKKTFLQENQVSLNHFIKIQKVHKCTLIINLFKAKSEQFWGKQVI